MRLNNKLVTVYESPVELTRTNQSDWSLFVVALSRALHIQGNPKHNNMSNVLEPMLFETAIEP